MGPFQSRLSWQKHTKKKKFQSLCQPPKHTQKMQFQSLCQPLIRHFLEDPFLQGKHRVNGQLLVTRKCLMDGTNLGQLSFDLFKINSDVCSFHFEIKLNFFCVWSILTGSCHASFLLLKLNSKHRSWSIINSYLSLNDSYNSLLKNLENLLFIYYLINCFCICMFVQGCCAQLIF